MNDVYRQMAMLWKKAPPFGKRGKRGKGKEEAHASFFIVHLTDARQTYVLTGFLEKYRRRMYKKIETQ